MYIFRFKAYLFKMQIYKFVKFLRIIQYFFLSKFYINWLLVKFNFFIFFINFLRMIRISRYTYKYTYGISNVVFFTLLGGGSVKNDMILMIILSNMKGRYMKRIGRNRKCECQISGEPKEAGN